MSGEIPKELYAHMIKPIESKVEKQIETVVNTDTVKTITPEVVKPKSLDEWAEKTREILRKGNSDYEVIKKSDLKTIRPKSFMFWKILSVGLLLSILVLSGIFLYFIQEGKLESSVNNTISCPEVIIPTCPIAPSCPGCVCPSLSCANQTPQINVNLANLNCTVK